MSFVQGVGRDGGEGMSFYVDLRRDSRVSLLAGPFATLAEAEAIKDRAYETACAVDPFARFDSYGTCRVDLDRPGVLNRRLGL